MAILPPPTPGATPPPRPKRSTTTTVIWIVAICVGGAAALLVGVFTLLGSSDVTKSAVSRAQTNPAVIERLGQPIKQGWLVQGKIQVSGPSGQADISIPLSGPKAKGTLYVSATKSAGEWTYQTLQLDFDGESRRIDLLTKEPAGQ